MDLSSSSSGQRRRRRRRAHSAEEAAETLRKAWCRLRLSARDPARVPPWDAVVLTAASPEQAALYNRQLERARSLGRFPASTTAIAVPDPDGARIGSGAATLHAVASLVRHLAAQVLLPPPSDNFIVQLLATCYLLHQSRYLKKKIAGFPGRYR